MKHISTQLQKNKGNQISENSIHPLLQLIRHINPRRRKQFGLLLILMVLASFAEVFSIGAIFPFLSVLIAPEGVFNHPAAQGLIQWLLIQNPQQLLTPLALLFAMAAIIASALRLLLLWSSNKLLYAAGSEIGMRIYERTLYQPYTIHTSRNSSEIIDGVTTKSHAVIIKALKPLIYITTNAILVAAILVSLLLFKPIVAFTVFGSLTLIYLIIVRVTKAKLSANSFNIAESSTARIKSLQEGLGGIRDLLLDGTQATFCNIYGRADLKLRNAESENAFISESPRYLLEALGLVAIAVTAWAYASVTGNISEAIPLLGALAVGAQRLMPMLQQLFLQWANLRSGEKQLLDSLALLEQPLPAYVGKPEPQPLAFDRDICMDAISFRYSETAPWILQNLSLRVVRGSRIGVVGTTGSGKSTLLDLLMGLLLPSQGQMLIDGLALNEDNLRAWQKHIAHVPQSIFLADGTIEENIAFGVPGSQIDAERVKLAAQLAQISETIEALPLTYQTLVGERGTRLSGGQRQRIGIARALYKQADVIVLDEATSALDTQTALAVMRAIDSLDRNITIFIIAHRLSTLESCDMILEVHGGAVRIKSSVH